MHPLLRTLVGGAIGGASCAAAAFALFVGLALRDGTRLGEALGFGLIILVIAAAFGFAIGAVVAYARLGLLGGALCGAATTVLLVALYIFGIGSRGRLGHFLSESLVIVIVMALPAVLGGVTSAVFVRASQR